METVVRRIITALNSVANMTLSTSMPTKCVVLALEAIETSTTQGPSGTVQILQTAQ